MPGDANPNSNGNKAGSQASDGKPDTACYATPEHDESLVRETVRCLNAQCKNPSQTRKTGFILTVGLDDGEPQEQMCTFDLCTEISEAEFQDALKMAFMADLAEHNMWGGLFATMHDPLNQPGETPQNSKNDKKRQRQ